MEQTFTAIYTKQGKWYLGWVEEIPGVNTQGKTLREARENLSEALALVLAENRRWTRRALPRRSRTRMIRERVHPVS